MTRGFLRSDPPSDPYRLKSLWLPDGNGIVVPCRWLERSSSREEMLLLVFHHYLVRLHHGGEHAGALVLALVEQFSRRGGDHRMWPGFTEVRRRHHGAERHLDRVLWIGQ